MKVHLRRLVVPEGGALSLDGNEVGTTIDWLPDLPLPHAGDVLRLPNEFFNRVLVRTFIPDPPTVTLTLDRHIDTVANYLREHPGWEQVVEG